MQLYHGWQMMIFLNSKCMALGLMIFGKRRHRSFLIGRCDGKMCHLMTIIWLSYKLLIILLNGLSRMVTSVTWFMKNSYWLRHIFTNLQVILFQNLRVLIINLLFLRH